MKEKKEQNTYMSTWGGKETEALEDTGGRIYANLRIKAKLQTSPVTLLLGLGMRKHT